MALADVLAPGRDGDTLGDSRNHGSRSRAKGGAVVLDMMILLMMVDTKEPPEP